jgi:DNA-binding IclR family transcriptional regulator
MPARPSRHGTQALERAARLLRELAARPRFGRGLTDLADRCGLDKGTAHRILACLVRERLAAQRPGDRRYLPGPLLFELGLALPAYPALQAAARAPLARIARGLGVVAGLTLRSGMEGVYAARTGFVAVKGMSIEVGDRRPLVMNSAGVAIVIALPAEDARAVIRDNLRAIEWMGRERVRLIRRMIAQSREAGYGINRDNTVVGVWGFGVPLRDRAGTVFGALSVAAPAAAFERVQVPALVAMLREEAGPIERAAPVPDADPGREPARALVI